MDVIEADVEQSYCAVIDDLFLRKDIYGLEALMRDPDDESVQSKRRRYNLSHDAAGCYRGCLL
jgi:hypothetical protein